MKCIEGGAESLATPIHSHTLACINAWASSTHLLIIIPDLSLNFGLLLSLGTNTNLSVKGVTEEVPRGHPYQQH